LGERPKYVVDDKGDSMKLKGTASLALLLTGALVLGACTSDADPGDNGTQAAGESASASASASASEGETTGSNGDGATDPCLVSTDNTETAAGEIRYTAGPGDWNGYNSITNATYSTYNNVIADKMFSSFTYFGTDGTICDDTTFGTYEVTSEDPMVVEYTISEDAVWSDGTPVTINDYLLDWAAQNPEFIAPGLASGENKDAEPVFDHVSISLAEKAPDGPQGEVGGKTFTIEYSAPNPDFKIMVTSALPSHIVAEQSGLEPDALAQAILDKDADVVKQAADFWNTGWIYEPGELPSDMSLVPSSGPYILKENGWQAGTALTVTKNDAYWGAPPATQDIVFRFLEDAAAAQALQNGDVQVIEPQATVDTVAQLEALAPAVTTEKFSEMTWEHLDYNFRDSSAFADSKGGKALREAFAYCVPRQTIVDNLVKPIDPEAVVMNAREVLPFQDNYEEVVGAAYDGRYDEVDLDKARELVEESGVATPIPLRIGYRAGNQRRTETVAQIQASCDQVGFQTQDISADDFFANALVNGDFDIALYAWAGSGQITSGQNIYASNGQQNNQGYANDTVDEAWKALSSTLDEAEQLEQVKTIETELWNDLFGLPLYAHPGVAAYDSKLQNVRPTATQSGVSWNASQWVAAS
jgi:peptide/nickel transport system substrate-binding protein